jgi:hypothetical protein
MSKRGRGNGSSIYLGKAIAVPPGVFIGRPGPTIFGKSHQADTATGIVIDFTGNFVIDLTALQIILD